MIKERPILFSASMVRTILAGQKTQTRRVCKNQPHKNGGLVWWHISKQDSAGTGAGAPGAFIDKCPYGLVGDRLWVRESFMVSPDSCTGWSLDGSKCTGWLDYAAGGSVEMTAPSINAVESAIVGSVDWDFLPKKWRSSLFMPRWASRILLEITNIRVEQLNNISEADTLAEGIHWNEINEVTKWCRTPVDVFKELWESINGSGSWDKNPWVWVVEFKVIEIKH